MSAALRAQIENWQNRGVIDDATAGALLADLAQNGAVPPPLMGIVRRPAPKARRFSFFQIVVTFAVICFCAALLLFISANWDAIPRLVKVAGVFTIIAGGFLAGAWLNRSAFTHAARLEELAYLTGGAGFVGGLALIGQMYHLPGDISSAMLVYALGLGFAGLLVRSPLLVAASLGAAVWWYAGGPSPENLLRWQFPVALIFCAVGYGFGWWRNLKWLRSVSMVGLVICVAPFALEVLEFVWDVYQSIPVAVRLVIWLLVFAVSVSALWLTGRKPELIKRIMKGWTVRPRTCFATMLVSLFALHILFEKGDALAIPAALGIIASLVALHAHGASNRAMRYVAYTLFGAEVALLYLVTLSSLLSTSGFFLAVGLFLSLLAVFIWRFEARFAKEASDG